MKIDRIFPVSDALFKQVMADVKSACPVWKVVSSVTSGGKGVFYFRPGPDGRQWIVWDRFLKSWILEVEVAQ